MYIMNVITLKSTIQEATNTVPISKEDKLDLPVHSAN